MGPKSAPIAIGVEEYAACAFLLKGKGGTIGRLLATSGYRPGSRRKADWGSRRSAQPLPGLPLPGLEVLTEFVEVETGKGSDALDRRPGLAEALAKAKRAKAPVVVAKLCRHHLIVTHEVTNSGSDGLNWQIWPSRRRLF